MNMQAVRSAFATAAGLHLRLDHAGLTYQGSGGRQVLSFTGWHSDGTPFAMVTAPFEGFAVIRAAQAARDIIAGHTGSELRNDGMSQKGSGLARLMGGLKNLDASADALATRLETAMGSLQTEMATTAQIVGNVEASVTDLRSINAQYSNGGPTSGGSGQS